jgi:hypothetical protein
MIEESQTKSLSKEDNKLESAKSFYCEPRFYEMADNLRTQFDKKIRSAALETAGMTAFSYAFCQESFQFLTANAERVFSSTSVQSVIDTVRSWAEPALGTTYVSTPQLRIYIRGCRRSLLRDDIEFPWRYCLSLTRTQNKPKIGCMTIAHNVKDARQPRGKVVMCTMEFNQFIVHKTSSAYSIETSTKSMNPMDAAVFIDGYLW